MMSLWVVAIGCIYRELLIFLDISQTMSKRLLVLWCLSFSMNRQISLMNR